MLDKAISLCAACPALTPISEALQDNRADEIGEAAQFRSPEEGKQYATPEAHHLSRAVFLQALGIDPQKPSDFPLYKLKDNENIWELVGVLLIAERTIPHEAHIVLQALEKVFPDQFADNQQNARRRHYLADHYEHDRKIHYPELLEGATNALMNLPEEQKTEALQQIRHGAQRFVEERGKLYDHNLKILRARNSLGQQSQEEGLNYLLMAQELCAQQRTYT